VTARPTQPVKISWDKDPGATAGYDLYRNGAKVSTAGAKATSTTATLATGDLFEVVGKPSGLRQQVTVSWHSVDVQPVPPPPPPPSDWVGPPAGAVLVNDWATVASWAGGWTTGDNTGAAPPKPIDTSGGTKYVIQAQTYGKHRTELDQGGSATTGAGAVAYGAYVYYRGILTIDPSSDLAAIPESQGGVNVLQLHPFTDPAAGELLRLYRAPGKPLMLQMLVQGGQLIGTGYSQQVTANVEPPVPAKLYRVEMEYVYRGDAKAVSRVWVNGVKLDFGQGTDNLPCASLEGGGRPGRFRNGIYGECGGLMIYWQGSQMWKVP